VALRVLLLLLLVLAPTSTEADGHDALLALLGRFRLALPAGHRQLLLVTAEGWGASQGELRRLALEGGRWRTVGKPLAVRLGRRGLARGRGLHDDRALASGPAKHEGDRRSPAGIFALGTAFGRGEAVAPPAGRWPYRAVDARDRFVDDPRSPHYNTWQRLPASGRAAWRSAEELARYRLGVVVLHNAAPVRASAGSAIFLHDGDGRTASVGCTTLAQSDLLLVLRWLSPEAKPLLVQVPGQLPSR